jgi:exodeoxyribonuclease VII large subunit
MNYRNTRNSPSLFEQVQEKSQRAADREEQHLSVSALTKTVKNLLEARFTDVIVEGEVSNYTHHRSGHRYFTLKDPDAQISGVIWKTRPVNFNMKDGIKVVCRGRLTVYPPSGRYQLDVMNVRPLGVGELQKAFEEMHRRLAAEGLFDPTRKRAIPQYPKRIGIVTSETGAALHDILTVLRRRYPITEVILRPAAVQGIGAEREIARAIQEFNLTTGDQRPDVLIVGRGGGSLEDLWSFNEEAVARAIFASRIPIISAVGHEVDITIADLVADLRAPTPTAAAELATPDRQELLAVLRQTQRVLTGTVAQHIRNLRRELTNISGGYSLNQCVVDQLEKRGKEVSQRTERLRRNVDHTLEKHRLTLERDKAKLAALDPYAVLKRGYAIVQRPDGTVIPTKQAFGIENRLRLVFADGETDLMALPVLTADTASS